MHVGALRALGDDLPVTVRFFIEGEEEVSSETLPELLRQYRDRLAADVIVIADAGNWDIGVPSLTTSLRGLIRVDVEVRTLTHAVHSGMWGGLVPDAIMALTRLLATLWTEDGSPAVAGPRLGRPPPTWTTRRNGCGPSPAPRRGPAGSAPARPSSGCGPGPPSRSPAWTPRRSPAPPTPSSRSPAPASRSASRPVTPARTRIARLQEHLEKHVPWGAQLTTTVVDAGEPTVLPTTGPAYAAARSALAEAWDGTAPVDMGTGGSIPFIAEFQETFPGASILVTGVEDPDTRAHGPNEGLHLPEFERAVLAEALLLQRLGRA